MKSMNRKSTGLVSKTVPMPESPLHMAEPRLGSTNKVCAVVGRIPGATWTLEPTGTHMGYSRYISNSSGRTSRYNLDIINYK